MKCFDSEVVIIILQGVSVNVWSRITKYYTRTSFASVHFTKKSGSVYLFLLHPVYDNGIFFASQSLSQFMRFSISCFFALSYSIPPQSPLPSTFILYIKFDLQNVIIHHKSITFEIFPPFLLSVINKCLQFGVRWIHRL